MTRSHLSMKLYRFFTTFVCLDNSEKVAISVIITCFRNHTNKSISPVYFFLVNLGWFNHDWRGINQLRGFRRLGFLSGMKLKVVEKKVILLFLDLSSGCPSTILKTRVCTIHERGARTESRVITRYLFFFVFFILSVHPSISLSLTTSFGALTLLDTVIAFSEQASISEHQPLSSLPLSAQLLVQFYYFLSFLLPPYFVFFFPSFSLYASFLCGVFSFASGSLLPQW